MARFVVQFEDIGYSRNPNLGEARFDECEAEGYTDQAVSEAALPEGVCAVLGGYLSADDPTDEHSGEHKFFACVKLVVEAADQEEAEEFAAPVELLNEIVDLMVAAATDDDATTIELDGDWEILEAVTEEA